MLYNLYNNWICAMNTGPQSPPRPPAKENPPVTAPMTRDEVHAKVMAIARECMKTYRKTFEALAKN